MSVRTLVLAAVAAATVGPLAAAGTASAAPARAVPSCGNHAITVTATGEQGATGHSNVILLFRNHTHHRCSLHGYPGVDALRHDGSVLAHARRTVNGFTGGSRHGVPTVVLRPGQYASADLEWTNFNTSTGGTCATAGRIAVTPANTARSTVLHRPVTKCNLQVHPTVRGKSGNG